MLWYMGATTIEWATFGVDSAYFNELWVSIRGKKIIVQHHGFILVERCWLGFRVF